MGQITTRGSDILRQADEVTLTLQQRLEAGTGLLSHLQPLHEVVSGDGRGAIKEGIDTGQLESFEIPVADLSLPNDFVFSHLVRQPFTEQTIGHQLHTDLTRNLKLLAIVGRISKSFQDTFPFHKVLASVLGHETIVDILGIDRGCIDLGFTHSEEAPTSIADLKEAVEVFLCLGSVEEFRQGSEHQHVGRCGTMKVDATLVLSRVLDQLGLDPTKVIQLKEHVDDLSLTS